MVILFNTSSTDSTWNAITFGSLTMLEGSTYVMASCLPLYRPFIQAAGKRIGSTFQGSKFISTNNSRGTKKGDDLELAAIREATFNESGFERLHDDKGKTQVTASQLHRHHSNSTDSDFGNKRITSGIQVKKEYTVENVRG